jgi:hypothetical protein
MNFTNVSVVDNNTLHVSRIDFLSRCDENTQMDNKGQSQIFLDIGQFNATCFGLTCSHFRANQVQRLSKSLATI